MDAMGILDFVATCHLQPVGNFQNMVVKSKRNPKNCAFDEAFVPQEGARDPSYKVVITPANPIQPWL